LIYSAHRPACAVIPYTEGEIEVGRGMVRGVLLEDERLSRKHATVAQRAGLWVVNDLGSTNGTFVDGARVSGQVETTSGRILRLGGSVFLLCENVRPFLESPTRTGEGGIVVGATLAATHAALARAAQAGENVFLTGATGTGKEVAARIFHELGPKGPFVAVNCATIQQGVAERLLFGAKKGAYSGADGDADGYLQAADGGTLFLDEVAELDLSVQAKLLRAIEAKEVLALGATKPRRVSFRLCCATLFDIRDRAADGRFREDLYFRVGRPEVKIPPLRRRLEELPFHVMRELASLGEATSQLRVDGSFIEACCLRPWPGNVRELAGEIRRAALDTLAVQKKSLGASDLDAHAGVALRVKRGGSSGETASVPRDEISEALRLEGGNVSRAAARLGVHRNRVRRWLDKHGVDRRTFHDDIDRRT
jgi:DNA-binding NtrC family response regulator